MNWLAASIKSPNPKLRQTGIIQMKLFRALIKGINRFAQSK